MLSRTGARGRIWNLGAYRGLSLTVDSVQLLSKFLDDARDV